MRRKTVLYGALMTAILAGCTNTEQVSTTEYFEGTASYQLNAADVFRLAKQMKQRDLVKSLKPLYGESYYSEEAFKSAISTRLNRELSDELYKELKQKAVVAPQVLSLEFVADNTLRVRFGHEQVPLQQKLLDMSALTLSSLDKLGKYQWATSSLVVAVEPTTLCVKIQDKQGSEVNQVCPAESTGFTLYTDHDYHYHGLGQEFQKAGDLDGRWNQRTRHAGNKMEGFNGGATGNTIIPILYGATPTQSDFALYLNNLYSSEWQFDGQEINVKASKGASEIIVMVAPKQKELRKQFMQLSGKPLVPPRKMFGMWLSEYGFDNWAEMDSKLATLRDNQFPIDGVVMDLQWFGNVSGNDPDSQMGSLTWDRENFPQPEQKIAQLKQQGIGMVLIEESYVSQGLDEFKALEEKGYLAKDPETGLGANVNPHGGGSWWGKGGMIDWSNPEVNGYWHDWKRQPLIDMGVMGHWTDLGEPEMYNHQARYFGDQAHDEIHNLFNYYWLEGIYQGYQNNDVDQRPFMMSRSGTTGIQKFGASMWSADIGSNLTSLATHIGQQTNMMLSGIDYYGSDIGGFHRKGLGVIGEKKQAALDETYTQWFAYSSLFDVPVRPHTENLCNCKETAPDRIGDRESNRNNLALRYEIIPYLYSLAHHAHQDGEAIFAPVSYEFSEDSTLYDIQHQKMIGNQLMSAVVAELDAKDVTVTFPQGDWFDFRTGTKMDALEAQSKTIDLYNEDNQYQLPLFAKQGAIIPVSKSSAGQWTSEVPQDITLKIFGFANNAFTLVEDDGKTTDYLHGAKRETQITTRVFDSSATLSIESLGKYQGMPSSRALEVNWSLGAEVQVSRISSNAEQAITWKQSGNQLYVKLAQLPEQGETTITLEF